MNDPFLGPEKGETITTGFDLRDDTPTRAVRTLDAYWVVTILADRGPEPSDASDERMVLYLTSTIDVIGDEVAATSWSSNWRDAVKYYRKPDLYFLEQDKRFRDTAAICRIVITSTSLVGVPT